MLSVSAGVKPMMKSDSRSRPVRLMLSLYSPDSVNDGVSVIQPWWAGGLKRSGPVNTRGAPTVSVSLGNTSSGTRRLSVTVSDGGGGDGPSSAAGGVVVSGTVGTVGGAVTGGGVDGVSVAGGWAPGAPANSRMALTAIPTAIPWTRSMRQNYHIPCPRSNINPRRR